MVVVTGCAPAWGTCAGAEDTLPAYDLPTHKNILRYSFYFFWVAISPLAQCSPQAEPRCVGKLGLRSPSKGHEGLEFGKNLIAENDNVKLINEWINIVIQ